VSLERVLTWRRPGLLIPLPAELEEFNEADAPTADIPRSPAPELVFMLVRGVLRLPPAGAIELPPGIGLMPPLGEALPLGMGMDIPPPIPVLVLLPPQLLASRDAS
jgi:hypothetical protein